jgi:hypothetical protein
VSYTLKESSEFLLVSKRWLRNRITDGTLPAVKQAGKYVIDEADLEHLQSLSVFEAYRREQKSRLLNMEPRPYVPSELRGYHRFHQAINEFTWLLKAYYTPRESLKRKQFRIDWLLQWYILEAVADSQSIRRHLVPASLSAKKLLRDSREGVKKVWYNELAYVTPNLLDPFWLGYKGVETNVDICAERFVFPSWKITQAYYAIYHAYRALCDLVGAPYRIEEHRSPLKTFKASKLSPALRTFFCFPFSIRYGLPTRRRKYSLFVPREKDYLKYKYAVHPRPPRRHFSEILQRVVCEFRRRWSGWSQNRQAHDVYMLPDLLHDFRNWVNYVDISNMVALKGQGFRAYLDLDLHTLIFFHAAMVELVALAVLGPDLVVELGYEFHEQFVKPESSLWTRDSYWPMDIRFQIYKHLGRLGERKWDPELPPSPPGVSLLQTSAS